MEQLAMRAISKTDLQAAVQKSRNYRRTGVLLVVVCAFVFYGLLGLLVNKALALEADYAEPWCAARGGVSGEVLADRTRVDCLLPGYAVEVDFARKWAEGMGQALHYARMTGRQPGVVLILEKPSDVRFAERLMADAFYHNLPLTVWITGVAPAYDLDGKNNKNGGGPP